MEATDAVHRVKLALSELWIRQSRLVSRCANERGTKERGCGVTCSGMVHLDTSIGTGERSILNSSKLCTLFVSKES